jgi:hypothetical protein
MDKTIRRVTDLEEQQNETYRYWQSRPIGERLLAVCELSEAAYAFTVDIEVVVEWQPRQTDAVVVTGIVESQVPKSGPGHPATSNSQPIPPRNRVME